MASNNYVPVKLLQGEIDALLSEHVLLDRDQRLDRMFMIYRLGLIDQDSYKKYIRDICSRYPDDLAGLSLSLSDGCTEQLTGEEIIFLHGQLCVRLDQLKYMIDKYTLRSGSEGFVEKERKEFSTLLVIANKICSMIDEMDQSKRS